MRYKVVITETEEKEVDERRYQNVAPEGEKERVEYVYAKVKRDIVSEVYSQWFDELDVSMVAKYLNE